MDPLTNAIKTAKVAYEAGFRGEGLILAVAIAGAESGFNRNATGDLDLQNTKWGPSVGLWQIRTLKNDFLHLDPVRDINRLYDPLANARAAFKISNGGNDWKPWSTYLNNRYKGFEQVAREAVSPANEIENSTIIPIAVLIVLILTIMIIS